MLAGCTSKAKATEPPAEVERVVIMGEITETVGNMLSINLIERRETPNFEMPEIEMTDEQREMLDSFRSGDVGSFASLSEEEIAALAEQFGGMMSRVGEGDQIMSQRRFSEGAALPEGFESMLSNLPEGFESVMNNFPEGIDGVPVFGRGRDYTGESRDIIIPAGAPIYESSYANGEVVETEISLEKLKTGDVIEVTYATDGETVAKVVKQQQLSVGPRTTRMGDGSFNVGGVDGETAVEIFNFIGGMPIGGAPAPR